jgi:hypothetical protein
MSQDVKTICCNVAEKYFDLRLGRLQEKIITLTQCFRQRTCLASKQWTCLASQESELGCGGTSLRSLLFLILFL